MLEIRSIYRSFSFGIHKNAKRLQEIIRKEKTASFLPYPLFWDKVEEAGLVIAFFLCFFCLLEQKSNLSRFKQ